MHAFPDADALHDVLDRLAERDLVARLQRRPGQKEERYMHLLSEDAETTTTTSPSPSPSIADVPAPPPPAEPGSDDTAQRLAGLEREVAELRAEMESLRR